MNSKTTTAPSNSIGRVEKSSRVVIRRNSLTLKFFFPPSTLLRCVVGLPVTRRKNTDIYIHYITYRLGQGKPV